MQKADRMHGTFEVTIEKLVYGGMGFARREGKVVFVPFSVPGDRVRVRPVEEKKTFVRADIVRLLQAGEGRRDPACPHFGRCGGCHWQQLDYPLQVEAKRRILEEVLRHRFPETGALPVVMHPCPQPLAYRSRARVRLVGAGPKAAVGFYRHKSHAIEDIESCPLLRPSLNEALGVLRQYRIKADTDAAPQEMDIACSEEEGTWATERAGASPAQPGVPLPGTRPPEDVILRRSVNGFSYAVTARSFFQANDFMVGELAALVEELSAGGGSGPAIDLFAGVGLFSLPLARGHETVDAVEMSAPSSRLCAINAAGAGLRNIRTVCDSAAAWLESEAPKAARPPDLVVLDPPRSGAGTAAIERIRQSAPGTVVYVSCDPQTLCRDLSVLVPRGYAIDFVRGLDMFPQTFHFETVVRLKRS